MFGNQQNRQAANAAAAGESFISNAEKRESPCYILHEDTIREIHLRVRT